MSERTWRFKSSRPHKGSSSHREDLTDIILEPSRTATRLAAPYGVKGYIVEEQVGGVVSGRSSNPYWDGEIFHSGVAGRVLSVGGKRVRRS